MSIADRWDKLSVPQSLHQGATLKAARDVHFGCFLTREGLRVILPQFTDPSWRWYAVTFIARFVDRLCELSLALKTPGRPEYRGIIGQEALESPFE